MVKCTKHLLILLLILSSIIMITYVKILPKYQPIVFNKNYNITGRNKIPATLTKSKLTKNFTKKTKIILYWIPMWDSPTFEFDNVGFDLFKNCEFTNCFATHDRMLVPIENFDAIVFHTAQYSERVHNRPWARNDNQRYIFANIESPIRMYPDNLKKYESFYNWTMTYRYDSDIVRSYGYIVKTATDYKPSIEVIKNKTDLVAWFVTNCQTINRREELYQNLRQFIKIDVYGACGILQCPKEMHISSSKCYDLIEQKYKFYLAFENSHCKDYVTEKLYKTLERDIVPVVYGAADYEKIAPPNSVIVADKFNSAESLANYLLYLNENPEQYLKYFEWKKSYRIETDQNKTVCQLCKMINDHLEPKHVYQDIFSWWVGKNHIHCKLGDNLPNISIPIL